ncbi:MAG: divalent-cation tolerance protein CutA [Magnetococcales bacterium]|nr:divalent-cation tolerance protein CutA [Magnetococcales bacterium]
MEATEMLLVWCSVANDSEAQRLAETVVNERLAACVHLFPSGRSIYLWQGALHHDAEVMLLIKTQRALYPLLEQRLRELHTYQVPEILAVGVEQGLPAYLAWVADTIP